MKSGVEGGDVRVPEPGKVEDPEGEQMWRERGAEVHMSEHGCLRGTQN